MYLKTFQEPYLKNDFHTFFQSTSTVRYKDYYLLMLLHAAVFKCAFRVYCLEGGTQNVIAFRKLLAQARHTATEANLILEIVHHVDCKKIQFCWPVFSP